MVMNRADHHAKVLHRAIMTVKRVKPRLQLSHIKLQGDLILKTLRKIAVRSYKQSFVSKNFDK